MAIVYLCTLSIKAVANIEPRKWNKVELNWNNNYEKNNDPPSLRPATEKELRDSGWIVDTIYDEKGACLQKKGIIYWCDYWLRN